MISSKKTADLKNDNLQSLYDDFLEDLKELEMPINHKEEQIVLEKAIAE